MPKLINHPDFSMAFPETFTASLVRNCPCMEELAIRLQSAISQDYLTQDRELIPGLREAIRQLAEIAET